MNEEEKIMIETNRSITNMEACFINKIKELEQKNQQLKEQLEASEKARKEAIEFINREIEIIKEQPSENKSIDEYVLAKYNGLLKILKEVE